MVSSDMLPVNDGKSVFSVGRFRPDTFSSATIASFSARVVLCSLSVFCATSSGLFLGYIGLMHNSQQ